jgi:hypothetical protein
MTCATSFTVSSVYLRSLGGTRSLRYGTGDRIGMYIENERHQATSLSMLLYRGRSRAFFWRALDSPVHQRHFPLLLARLAATSHRDHRTVRGPLASED